MLKDTDSSNELDGKQWHQREWLDPWVRSFICCSNQNKGPTKGIFASLDFAMLFICFILFVLISYCPVDLSNGL
jgi:hypothetical protein